MQPDRIKPAYGKQPVDSDSKTIQPPARSDTEPAGGTSGSAADLRKAAEDLKTKIAEAKRRNDLPVDSALGNPGWERSAADGRFGVAEEDDE
jgi:hypothetical protein